MLVVSHAEQKGELANLDLTEANRLVRSGQVDRWQADVQIKTLSGETRWVTDMSTEPGTPRLIFYNRYMPAEMLAGDFMEIIPISDREDDVCLLGITRPPAEPKT